MYIVNDICYADTNVSNIKIIKAKHIKGRILLVEFSTGEKRLFDTTILTGSVFKLLENDDIFNNLEIFHGIITWNNREIDVSPELVYEKSFAYNEYDF